MAKAFQLIREIEESLLEFYPKKPLLSFDIVKTDYYIRRGNFKQGKVIFIFIVKSKEYSRGSVPK